MTKFEELKNEIAEMDLDQFMSLFISGRGMRDYVCGDIKHPHSQCTKSDDYNCLQCLRDFLRSNANE